MKLTPIAAAIKEIYGNFTEYSYIDLELLALCQGEINATQSSKLYNH
jgi:hypothetical protein